MSVSPLSKIESTLSELKKLLTDEYLLLPSKLFSEVALKGNIDPNDEAYVGLLALQIGELEYGLKSVKLYKETKLEEHKQSIIKVIESLQDTTVHILIGVVSAETAANYRRNLIELNQIVHLIPEPDQLDSSADLSAGLPVDLLVDETGDETNDKSNDQQDTEFDGDKFTELLTGILGMLNGREIKITNGSENTN